MTGFKRRIIRIALNPEAHMGKKHARVEAYVIGQWGVNHNISRGRWNVSHVPTRYGASQGIDFRKAVKLARVLHKRLPKFKTKAEVKNLTGVKDAFEEAGVYFL